MKTLKIVGGLLAIAGAFSALVLAEPTGILAIIGGMFPFVLISG